MAKLIIGESNPIPAKILEQKVPLPFSEISSNYEVVEGKLCKRTTSTEELLSIWPKPGDMEGVTNLGEGVFKDAAKNWTANQRDALTKIDFSSLTSLTNKNVLYDAFYTGQYPNVTEIDFSNLKEINVEGATGNANGTLNYTFYQLRTTTYGKPITINFNSLEKIKGKYTCWYTFYGCKDLYYVDFPKLKEITTDGTGNAAYYMFSNTKDLIEARFESLKRIEGTTGLFGGGNASGIQKIYMPALKQIENSNDMFKNCANLTEVVLGTSDLILGPSHEGINATNGLFYNCTGLTSINLDSVIKIDERGACCAFKQCSNLQHVSLANLKEIGPAGGWEIFQYCTSLTSISFDSLMLLKDNQALYLAFRGCTSLTDIYFPKLGDIDAPAVEGLVEDCTDVKIHFSKDLYPLLINKYGDWFIENLLARVSGTNTSLLFDLPELEKVKVTILADFVKRSYTTTNTFCKTIIYNRETDFYEESSNVDIVYDDNLGCGVSTIEIFKDKLTEQTELYIHKTDKTNYSMYRLEEAFITIKLPHEKGTPWENNIEVDLRAATRPFDLKCISIEVGNEDIVHGQGGFMVGPNLGTDRIIAYDGHPATNNYRTFYVGHTTNDSDLYIYYNLSPRDTYNYEYLESYPYAYSVKTPQPLLLNFPEYTIHSDWTANDFIVVTTFSPSEAGEWWSLAERIEGASTPVMLAKFCCTDGSINSSFRSVNLSNCISDNLFKHGTKLQIDIDSRFEHYPELDDALVYMGLVKEPNRNYTYNEVVQLQWSNLFYHSTAILDSQFAGTVSNGEIWSPDVPGEGKYVGMSHSFCITKEALLLQGWVEGDPLWLQIGQCNASNVQDPASIQLYIKNILIRED